MKMILSRKGFDASSGGMASPILPDGRLLPLPIPSIHDHHTFADLAMATEVDLGALLADLSNSRYSLHSSIHRDPELDPPRGGYRAGHRLSLIHI